MDCWTELILCTI